MKKAFSFLLAICVIISSGLCFLSFADTPSNSLSAEQFASEISGMMNACADSVGLPGNENDSTGYSDEFKTSRLIVKSKHEIDTFDAVSVVNGYNDLWVLQFSSPQKTKDAFLKYSSDDSIEFVEADKEINALFSESLSESVSSAGLISEEETHLSWGPEFIGANILNNNINLMQIQTKRTIVAVIDTGVDPNHSFFNGRILPTRINTSTSGIRNDSMDDNGHGTQVAGVIVDTTHDNVFVQPYKVLDKYGAGTTLSLAAGINCAIEDGVDVINISIGFDEESEVLKSAIDNAEINNILVVSASGNDGTDKKYYPASYNNVVKVTAVNKSGIVTNFSTYDNGVDFAAPGYEIQTTTLNGKYIKTRGTSVAAPFVAAVAAIIISYRETANPEEILEIMINACFEVSEHNSEIKYGNGIIRAPEQPDKSKLKDVVSAPYFSHETSFSQTELDVEIFCDTSGAQIYYTTDRSIPSPSNPNAILYDGKAIHASQTIIITAAAYHENMYRSAITSFASIIAPYVSADELTVTPSGTLLSYSGNATSITIPDTINGIEIKSIGACAFENKNVTEVILPDSVTSIDNGSFRNCTKLKTILARNASSVGDYAFYNCEWLKNIFLLSDLKSIGKYSFYAAGKKQNIYTGSTFTLKLSLLTSIPEGAFAESAISSVELGNIKSIEYNSFQNCNQLVNVQINNLLNMPNACFNNCASLTSVEISGLGYIPQDAFRNCSDLLVAIFPDVKKVFGNSFEACSGLVEVGLPSADLIYSTAFKGCTDLSVLNLPEMESFEEEIYAQTSPQIYLPVNLKRFYAPKFKRTVPRMFITSNKIEIIGLNGVENIAANSFAGCYEIYSLNIESVQSISTEAFNNCSIVFIDARSLVTTTDMPDNSGILLSNNFVESTDIATNLTIYGTKNTFVERYAKLKGYEFIEIPLIYSQTPEYITENSETVYILAAGFDLTYQWYWNTVPETVGGTAIEGATTQSYTFTKDDSAPYYYCEIIQNDLGIKTRITTNIITKDTIPADYTEYNLAVKKANGIDRYRYENSEELDKALSVDVSGRYSCEQDIVDAQTRAILNAIENLILKTIKEVNLYATESTLRFLQAEKIIAVFPSDIEYKGFEWSTSDDDVIIVSSMGRVLCIDEGTAAVRFSVENTDGSITECEITFECKLNFWERIASFILKDFIKFIYRS